jgi:small subunit ribosomal protein S1
MEPVTGKERPEAPEDRTPEAPEAEEFAALFAREARRAVLAVGDVVRGRVVLVDAETVFVDVQGKGEAVIDRAELDDADGRPGVAVGDEIEATVVSTGEEVRLSRKLLRGARARLALEAAAASGIPVEGKVAGVNRGGYEVTVGGLRGFCPASQMELRRVEAPESYVGRILEFRVVRYAEHGRDLLLSRRQLLEERAAAAAEAVRKTIVPGAVLPGTVVSLAAFGAFVDLGGVQGLVPVSEISHSRVGRPADRLQVGEAVTVKVLKVDGDRGRISLSLKALEGDPWAAVPARLREREVVRGRIVRVTEFGAFVELLPGVDGLVHVSEIPRARQGELREASRTMAELAVLVLGIDLERRRIALALAPAGLAPGTRVDAALAAGDQVTGHVERVEPFGVLVRLGPGQVGLVPTAETGTAPGADLRREFPPGAEVTVVVLAVEEGGRRIRLSRAQALAREEQAEARAYRASASERRFGVSLGDLIRARMNS